jgi:predicted lipase
MNNCFVVKLRKSAAISTILVTFSFVSFSQSQWGFSLASTEYYSADSSHREYVFFSEAVDIATLDCSKVNTHTITGEEREKTKVLSECLSKWFFNKLKESKNEGVMNITSERALISQVEKMHEKGKECTDYDVPCFFKNQEEAKNERKTFMKRAKKLGARVFEVE